MLYLAHFELRKTGYMSEDKCSDNIRLIEADSKEEAKIKLYKEYEVDYEDCKDPSKNFSFESNDVYNKNYLQNIDISPIIK